MLVRQQRQHAQKISPFAQRSNAQKMAVPRQAFHTLDACWNSRCTPHLL